MKSRIKQFRAPLIWLLIYPALLMMVSSFLPPDQTASGPTPDLFWRVLPLIVIAGGAGMVYYADHYMTWKDRFRWGLTPSLVTFGIISFSILTHPQTRSVPLLLAGIFTVMAVPIALSGFSAHAAWTLFKKNILKNQIPS